MKEIRASGSAEASMLAAEILGGFQKGLALEVRPPLQPGLGPFCRS
jgi:hypothetical protein